MISWEDIQRGAENYRAYCHRLDAYLATLSDHDRLWFNAMDELICEIEETQLLAHDHGVPVDEAINNCAIRLGSSVDLFEALRKLDR